AFGSPLGPQTMSSLRPSARAISSTVSSCVGLLVVLGNPSRTAWTWSASLPAREATSSTDRPCRAISRLSLVPIALAAMPPIAGGPYAARVRHPSSGGVPCRRELAFASRALRVPGAVPEQARDWNEREVTLVRSRGGVPAVCDFSDNLIRDERVPWPPPPVVQ